MNNTLNIGRISEGFVLDHIQAGKSMDIYKYLRLDKLDCCVAIIKNAKSNKMGKRTSSKSNVRWKRLTWIFWALLITTSPSISLKMRRL